MRENIAEEIYEKYQNYLNPSLARLLKVSGCANIEDRAEGCYIYDHEGRAYLDCLGGYGVFTFGHRNPKIIEAILNQLNRMPLSARVFLNEPQANAAEKLAQLTPGDLQYTFFGNSGAEAIEGAVKLARLYTKKPGIIATNNAFHGKTIGALSITGREVYRTPFEPLLQDVTFIPFGDSQALREAIKPDTAAFIVEPIQGEGGVIVPKEGYLKEVREITKEKGILFIADEIQTGMGRTGYNFAVESEGVVPDIMVLAKALGGGILPIGAFISTPEIWKVFEPMPLVHTSTFGGNPLATTAALASLELLEKENIAKQAREKGIKLMSELSKTAELYPDVVKEVRGRGLLIGVEFHQTGYAGAIMMKMVENGVVVAYTLNNPSVIRFEPPVVISEEEIEKVGAVFRKAVEESVKILGGK